MKNLRNVLICLKNALKKIRVFATIVLVGLLLTACCNQKEIVQPTIKIVPAHKIDTCFDVKSDTILWLETDTLRVEAIVKDTMLRLRVETKPIIVRDTTLTKGETEKAKIKKEKAKIEKEKAEIKTEKAKIKKEKAKIEQNKAKKENTETKKKDTETKKKLSLFFSLAGILILFCGGYWNNKK